MPDIIASRVPRSRLNEKKIYLRGENSLEAQFRNAKNRSHPCDFLIPREKLRNSQNCFRKLVRLLRSSADSQKRVMTHENHRKPWGKERRRSYNEKGVDRIGPYPVKRDMPILNSVSQVADPVRLTQVEEQTQRLEALAGDLEKIAELFSQRLSGVTRPSDTKDKQSPIPRPVLVPLAEKLNTIGDHISLAINAFRDLNDRIELP